MEQPILLFYDLNLAYINLHFFSFLNHFEAFDHPKIHKFQLFLSFIHLLTHLYRNVSFFPFCADSSSVFGLIEYSIFLIVLGCFVYFILKHILLY